MNLSYQCLNAFTNIYVSIAVFGHIASYSKGCMPYEGECNIKCVNYNKDMYLPNKVCAYWRQLHHIQLHSQTVFALSINICLQSSLCLKGKWEELVSAIDFATCHLTLYLPLINLVTDNLRRPEKLKLCYSYKKEEITTTPEMYLHHL